MSVLIAIPSCHKLRHYEQAVRETWITELPEGTDYSFFLGEPTLENTKDEVFLHVEDDLQSLTKKIVAMYRWALNEEYDFVFKADLDTLVRPDKLLVCGYEAHDYMGGQNHFFASGGAGYWLSRRAMEIVVAHPIVTTAEEDVHTAKALSAANITLHGDDRFKYTPGDRMDDDTITYHLSSVKSWSSKATPEDMYSVWKDQKNRNYKAYAVGQPPVRTLRLGRFK